MSSSVRMAHAWPWRSATRRSWRRRCCSRRHFRGLLRQGAVGLHLVGVLLHDAVPLVVDEQERLLFDRPGSAPRIIAGALAPERFERWFERRGVPTACGLIAALAFATSKLAIVGTLAETVLTALGEASSGLLFLFWLARCCRLSPRKTQLHSPSPSF